MKLDLQHAFVRLREERQRLNLSQDRICSLLGIARKTVYNYERTLKAPDARLLDRLGELAVEGFDVHYIVTGERPAAADQSAIDAPVLRSVIAGVEEFLNKTKARLPDDKKADLVVLMYQHAIQAA